MLAAIGAESIDELFDDVPEGVRLGRPLDLPAGQARAGGLRLPARPGGAERLRRGRGLVPRGRHVRPLRAGADRLDPLALGVPHALHAVPAGDLAGRAAGDVRVPDGDLGADRACRSPTPASTRARARVAAAGYLAKLHQPSRTRFLVSRGLHPHSRETLATTSVGWGTTIEEIPLADGATDAEALEQALGDDVSAVFLQYPNFLGAVEDLEALVPAAKAAGALVIVAVRPAPARHPAPARRLRRRRRGGGGPDARQPARLRRPELRLLRRAAGLPAAHARPDRGRDDRRRRPPRLRAHAADARAAHPAREGDAQHLHRAGAQRARRRDLPELARPRRGSSSWAS